MRTDVKIGVGMGLLLVLALVGWQLVWNEKEPSPDANSPDGKRLATGPGQNGDGPSPSNPNRGLPRFGHVPGEIPVSPRIVESDGPVIPSIRETPEPPVIPSIREMPEPPPVTPVIPSIRETPEPPPVTPVIPSIRETPIMPFGPPAPGAGGTYEVQKGDSGFWAIAAKVYGDGRQWTLIAKANPGMDSNALRPGAKLIIPPKPVTRTETPDAAGMVPGEIVLSPSGQRQYVVKKGDSGFWAVSKAVYGNGKHWALIAEANPNADSNRLHPGDTLVIPDRAPATTTGTGASDPPPATITPGSGVKVYTVTKRDTKGFWGIAKKHYGNPVYWTLIAKANPKVKSSSLKVGQQLLIPELTAEAKRATVGASSRPRAGSRPAPRRPDIEDIGPTPKFD